jgi:hypothetical protein
MTQFRPTVTFAFCLASALIPAAQASLVATYTFDNTLAAQQTGVAALTAVDPLGTSGFQTASVFGNLQTTYQFNGAATPVLDQGGLDFDTTGLISSDDYSVEMVVELTGSTGWRRLLDASDRQYVLRHLRDGGSEQHGDRVFQWSAAVLRNLHQP